MDTFCWAVVNLAFVQIAKNPVGTLHALRRLADLHLSLEDDETALHIFHAVLEGGTKMDIHRLRAECMVGIGDIVLRRGNLIEAKEMWGVPTHSLCVHRAGKKLLQSDCNWNPCHTPNMKFHALSQRSRMELSVNQRTRVGGFNMLQ
jgi:hypothetical protein